MKKFKLRKEPVRKRIRGLLLTVFIIAMILGSLTFGTVYIAKMSGRHGVQVTREAVRRAVVQCYAIEGIYPPNVEHLVNEYGLTYDATKYYIFYEIFASNIMPTIEVYEKR